MKFFYAGAIVAITLTNLEPKIRSLIEDSEISGTDQFTYKTDSAFTLTESNVNSITTAYLKEVELSTSEYSFDSSTNKVTISVSMDSGDAVQFDFKYYPNYSSSVIQSYITAALVHISANNYKTWIIENSTIYPEPSDEEENLICMITSLLIKPDNKSYRLPDISITLPKDLPLHDKIRKTIAVFKCNTKGIFFIS